jgi:nucleoside-diphosphate-sugar epimerase
MDYFVPEKKSYMKALKGIWPLDLENWEAVIPGTGEERVGFTSARDVAKAFVKLIKAEKWVCESSPYNFRVSQHADE